MFAPLMSRLSVRLLVPALALSAIALLGEPLPAPAQTLVPEVVVELELADNSGPLGLLQQEAEALRAEAEAAKQAARNTAAQMRWFMTLPAVGSRRCATTACAS